MCCGLVPTEVFVIIMKKPQIPLTRIETKSRPIHVIEDEEAIFFTTTNDGVFRVSKQTKEVDSYQFDPLDPFLFLLQIFSEIQKQPICFIWRCSLGWNNKWTK